MSVHKPELFTEPTHLWFERESRRYVLAGKELHCGDCFQVLDENGTWHNVRIEMTGNRWYLVGLAGVADFGGMEARWYES